MFKLVAIAHLMADFEMLAVDERSRIGLSIGSGEQRGIDGTAGGDGAGDDVFDEITARLRHEGLLRALQKFARFRTDAACSNAIPDDDEHDGNDKDERGDGVDFRSDAAT